jgi:hypothetical protein
MTSDTLQKAIEQNHKNLKALLKAVDADFEMPAPPEEKTERVEFFGGKAAADSDLSEEERLAWMFEQNSKALVAAAKAAGIPERKLADGVMTTGEKYAGYFVPDSEVQRQEQKRDIHSGRER